MNYEDCEDLVLGSRADGGDIENFNSLMHLYYHVIWKWLPKPLREDIEYGKAFSEVRNGRMRREFFVFHEALKDGRVKVDPDEHMSISLDEVITLAKRLLLQRQLTQLYVGRCASVRAWFSGLVADEINAACDELIPKWLAQIQ